MTNLKEIDIRCIRINEIDTLAFDQANCLESLTLAINPNFKASQEIENLDRFIEHTPMLKKLNLNGFKLNLTRPIGTRQLPNLTHLNLDSCGIKHLPANTFVNTLNLEELSIKCNHLYSLNGGLFERMIKLKKLNLSYNQLVHLNANMFSGLMSLEAVDFSYNFLSDINENAFASMTKLKRLNFHRNFLKILPLNTFKSQCGLEELILSFNKFTRMDEGFFAQLKCNSKSLAMLKLDMNRFSEWFIRPSFFEGFANLKCLYLGINNLENISNLNNRV